MQVSVCCKGNFATITIVTAQFMAAAATAEDAAGVPLLPPRVWVREHNCMLLFVSWTCCSRSAGHYDASSSGTTRP
jgi:hypothetical protein